MTIATRAPVIMPSMATPNRMSNQPMIRPAGDVTNAESPWPSTVAMPQLNESNTFSNVHGPLEHGDEDGRDDDEADDALGEGQEEAPVELTGDPLDVPADAADERRGERQAQRSDGASLAMMPEPGPRGRARRSARRPLVVVASEHAEQDDEADQQGHREGDHRDVGEAGELLGAGLEQDDHDDGRADELAGHDEPDRRLPPDVGRSGRCACPGRPYRPRR